MIKNIVFSGGGVKIYSFLGFIKAFEEQNLFEHVESYIGTSAGALISALCVLGFKYKEIEEIVLKINTTNLKNITTDNILNFFENFGLDNGESFERIITIILEAKLKNSNITFKELFDITNKKLIVTATCINTMDIEYFDYETTPDMSVILANEISACIPCYFTPIRYNKCVYVDGGILNNFPLNYISDDDKKYTIGLHTDNDNYNDLDIENNIVDYIISIYEITRCKILTNDGYIIKLNPDIMILDFNICKEDKIKCFEYGTNYMLKYISMNMLDLF